MIDGHYTPEFIHEQVNADMSRLFAPYAEGRMPNWSCDLRTKDMMATMTWLNEELIKTCKNEDDRRTQVWSFNRLSRTYDVFVSAAEVMNEVIDEKVAQNRSGHRRWG